MSKLFCLTPGLRVLERQMQQPPGYRPRGYGICIIEEMDWKSRGNYSEIVDCVISRMQLEHLKKRVEEIFADEELWDKVCKNVLDTGIYFDRARLGGVTLEQYILFHTAKDVYNGTKLKLFAQN